MDMVWRNRSHPPLHCQSGNCHITRRALPTLIERHPAFSAVPEHSHYQVSHPLVEHLLSVVLGLTCALFLCITSVFCTRGSVLEGPYFGGWSIRCVVAAILLLISFKPILKGGALTVDLFAVRNLAAIPVLPLLRSSHFHNFFFRLFRPLFLPFGNFFRLLLDGRRSFCIFSAAFRRLAAVLRSEPSSKRLNMVAGFSHPLDGNPMFAFNTFGLTIF